MLHRVSPPCTFVGEKDSYIAGIWFRLRCREIINMESLKKSMSTSPFTPGTRPCPSTGNRPRNPMGPCSPAGLHCSQPPTGVGGKSHCSTGRRRCRESVYRAGSYPRRLPRGFHERQSDGIDFLGAQTWERFKIHGRAAVNLLVLYQGIEKFCLLPGLGGVGGSHIVIVSDVQACIRAFS